VRSQVSDYVSESAGFFGGGHVTHPACNPAIEGLAVDARELRSARFDGLVIAWKCCAILGIISSA